MAIGQMLTAATNMATLIASWFANCEQIRCVAPGWTRRDCYLAGWLLEVEAEAEAEKLLEAWVAGNARAWSLFERTIRAANTGAFLIRFG